jgi:hypothetical protein
MVHIRREEGEEKREKRRGRREEGEGIGREGRDRGEETGKSEQQVSSTVARPVINQYTYSIARYNCSTVARSDPCSECFVRLGVGGVNVSGPVNGKIELHDGIVADGAVVHGLRDDAYRDDAYTEMRIMSVCGVRHTYDIWPVVCVVYGV